MMLTMPFEDDFGHHNSHSVWELTAILNKLEEKKIIICYKVWTSIEAKNTNKNFVAERQFELVGDKYQQFVNIFKEIGSDIDQIMLDIFKEAKIG